MWIIFQRTVGKLLRAGCNWRGKTSMRFMNNQNYLIEQAHLVWCDSGFDVMSVQRAS